MFPRDVKKAIEDWCIKYIGQKLPVTNEEDQHMVKLYDDRAEKVEKNTCKILSASNVEAGGPGSGRKPGWTKGMAAKFPAWRDRGIYIYNKQKGSSIAHAQTEHLDLMKKAGIKVLSGNAYANTHRGQYHVDHSKRTIIIRSISGHNFVPDDVVKDIEQKHGAEGYSLDFRNPAVNIYAEAVEWMFSLIKNES